MLKIGHVVTRPGRKLSDADVTIPVAEELETVPGIPIRQWDVEWYAREYPLESLDVTERVGNDWTRELRRGRKEMLKLAKESDKLTKPMRMAASLTHDLEPTAEPSGEDVSQLIKDKGRELGFVEVGITAYDHLYTFKSKKDYVKFPQAICLVYPQDYAMTQTIPSVEGERTQSSTGSTQTAAGLKLGDFIRSLGYHAQVIPNGVNPAPAIPMFVNAGLGQLGACGYLLTPHVGSSCRLMMITTDAKVTHDQPVDYGIQAFCQVCQVCVNRCPGRALMKEKIWWRGVEKNKVAYGRCRPVMARYYGCAVCMKVCPIQKYGMKNVLEHYAATGKVLGKGTHDLEGYTLEGKGYFGPGELPMFESSFFTELPRGGADEYVFNDFKAKAKESGGVITEEVLRQFKEKMTVVLSPKSVKAAEERDQSDI